MHQCTMWYTITHYSIKDSLHSVTAATLLIFFLTTTFTPTERIGNSCFSLRQFSTKLKDKLKNVYSFKGWTKIFSFHLPALSSKLENY